MLTIPNFISLLRFPLAFLFLSQDLYTRLVALGFAMLSDGLDGYLARKYKQSSQLGIILDPLMDRFFVFFVIGILMSENQLGYWEAGALLCRDFAVILFGFYLVLSGKLTRYRLGAIWCGKATTFLQFLFFFVIILKVTIPLYSYALFVVLGVLALLELYLSKEKLDYTA